MKKYGLLGKKLSHSFSPQIHKMLGGYDYELFEIAENELDGFMKSADFDGINVTTPYKKAVIPYCDELSDTAKEIGSVNTIVRRSDGSLYGDNTDYFGLVSLIKRNRLKISGKAVILGNGGVSPTVKTALEALGADEIIVVSRNGNNNYVNLSDHYDANVVVNATPVGMYPNNGECLIELQDFSKCSAVIDLIYNPLKTKLILDAEKLGISCAGGLYMLVAQAARACELFTGKQLDDERINKVYITLLTSVQNIILIGMPGCGKSSCGIELQKLTGRKLYDIDSEIEKRVGMSIPHYFKQFGVEAFRDIETEVLTDICKSSGAIIATGGGVVMRERNLNLLRSNGIIVFLQRSISELPTDNRPLSQSNSLSKLADMRLPIYNKWCDFKVKGISADDTAMKIKEMLKL